MPFAQNSSRPRLGECLSPERETMSLNPFLGHLGENHEPETKVILYNSFLGEGASLGRDLQGFKFVHTLNSLQPCPIHTTKQPKQNSIIAQHKTTDNTHQSCYFIHSYYPNSRLSHPYQIPYQNPNYTLYNHKDFTPKCQTNQFTFIVHRIQKCTSF